MTDEQNALIAMALDGDGLERTALETVMLAAWINVRPDQIPQENTTHLNAHSMAAWRRVGLAAIDFYTLGKVNAELERVKEQARAEERERAQKMHRRAQKAEGEIEKAIGAIEKAMYWIEAGLQHAVWNAKPWVTDEFYLAIAKEMLDDIATAIRSNRDE